MECLGQYGLDSVVLRWIDPESKIQLKYGMRDAIADWWRGDKDLIHIDHDMVFTWEHLRDFSNCESLWCTSPYYTFETLITAGLGFMKFSAELQRMVDIYAVFGDADTCVGCKGDWWGFEYHLVKSIEGIIPTPSPCTHRQVLNDHPIYGLKEPKGSPALSVDWHTEEGRAALVEHLRQERGWSLPNEPQ